MPSSGTTTESQSGESDCPRYKTVDGSARVWEKYKEAHGKLVFKHGEAIKTITVQG